MKILLFGATGMVGQGVLRECLRDPEVTEVLTVGRSATGQAHPKLREKVHASFTDYAAIEGDLAGYDACFFCLGVSASGMTEEAYHHITYDYAIATAEALLPRNPALTFIYVSGAGTDSTEKGRWMWARVKGKTENALLKMPFKAAYMFRPGVIQPLHGITSKTRLYRAFYAIGAPLVPLLQRLAPSMVTTTEQVGQAMLQVARHGADVRVLETADIGSLARAYAR